MNKIGTFELDEKSGVYRGEIVTLSVQARDVCIAPSGGDQWPSEYQVMVGRAQIGSGVVSTASDGQQYIALEIDDPSFAAPISARLISRARSSDFVLEWQRTSHHRT